MTHAETAAAHIRGELERGAVEWKKARADFDTERQNLQQAINELRTSYSWRDWLCCGMIGVTLILFGIIIGLRIVR